MKAMQINNYGGNDVISINDNVPIPKVPPGKVLVEVKVSGVNPVDWKIREG
jgi:NADPH:quinone reductase-like Zn-dependent oxidoreductase